MGTLSLSPLRVVTYTHNQTVPSTVWNVAHNLNSYPIVDVMYDDGAGNLAKIIPFSIVLNDMNNLTITFTVPFHGMARLAG